MSARTIQDLMLFMCAVKFDLEEEQLAFTRELTTRDEIELAQEEKGGQDRIDPISDTEEQNPTSNSMQPSPQPTRGRKRQMSVSSHDSHSSELSNEPDLPQQSTQRVSGRVRKRSRWLTDYEV